MPKAIPSPEVGNKLKDRYCMALSMRGHVEINNFKWIAPILYLKIWVSMTNLRFQKM